MKLLAINASPKGKNSNTQKFLMPFMEGASELGAEIETVYLNEKNIDFCKGCYTCWTRTPGKCIIKDDMEELMEKVKEADIIVYGTPLYKYTMTGLMKNFIDRELPLSLPFVEKCNGRLRHPGRFYDAHFDKKEVLISNCGFPERQNFKGLVETFNELTINQGHTILFPCGEYLCSTDHENEFAPYREALKNAAKEIATEGKISETTQAILDKTVKAPEVFFNAANEHWKAVGGR